MIFPEALPRAGAIAIILLLSFVGAQDNFRGNNEHLHDSVGVNNVGFVITAHENGTIEGREKFVIGMGEDGADDYDDNKVSKNFVGDEVENANVDNGFDPKNDEHFTAAENADAATSVEGKQSDVVKARSAHRILPADGARRANGAGADRKKSPPSANKTDEIRQNRNFADNNISGALTNPHDLPASRLIIDGCEETVRRALQPAGDSWSHRRNQIYRNNDTYVSVRKSILSVNNVDKERRAVSEKPFIEISEEPDYEYFDLKTDKSIIRNKTTDRLQAVFYLENDGILARNKEKTPKPRKEANMTFEDERFKDGENAIRFSAAPPRRRYRLAALRLTEGTFIFSFLTGIFSIVHPFEFPTDLLRDVIWKKLSVPQLLLQSIRIEVGFIIVIILGACMSLVTPVYAICHAILNSLPKTESRSEPGSLLDRGEITSRGAKRRMLLFLSQALMLLSLASSIGMIYSNEELRKTSRVTRSALEAAVHDVDIFASTAALELKHVLAIGADETMQAIDDDLTHIKMLLGEPIQRSLAAETGIDVTFEAVRDIVTATEEMTSKVQTVLEMTVKGSDLASSARDRLRDLQRQIDNVKRHCALRDQPLCETIDSHGVELVIQFDLLLAEKRLPSPGILGNLTDVAEAARKNLKAVPTSVDVQTQSVRGDIRRTLEERRESIHESTRVFDRISRHLSATARSFQARFDSWLRRYEDFDYWRWIIMLSASIIVILISSALIGGLMCGCCEAFQYAVPLLKTSVALICIYSMVLWTLATALFVFGGHGEVFICRPFYDEPDYRVLSRLVDKPGLLYQDRSSFFRALFKDANNVTIEVPIRDALRDCKFNRPSYPTFRLDRVLDMNRETEYFHWEQLNYNLKRIVVNIKDMKISTIELQEALQYTMTSSNANFTFYRSHLNGPLTGKDLTSLADQLASIGNQMTDVASSSRMETLASRTHRLVQTVLRPLDEMRTELVYKLTEMELQMQPYRRQINLAVSHLKTIEYYVDKQGVVIADKKTSDYVTRLIGYLEQYRGHVLDTIQRSAAPCGVIFTIFDVTRSLVCRHLNGSVNGFWFSSFLCAILWSVLTPLILELADCYRELQKSKRQIFPRSTSQENVIESGVIDSQGDSWSTPGPPPPQPDSW